MKILLFSCFLLIVFTSKSQQIKGIVVEAKQGRVIAGVTVEIERKATVATNDSGLFEFSVRPGKYVLQFSAIGFYQKSVEMVPSSFLQKIVLDKLALFMEPVEIRATRAGDKAPFTKTDINKSVIEKSNLGQDLPFLLNQTPSVVVNSDAGNGIGYTGIRIRGTDPSRINMTINGIPYNDAESQGLFFVNLPDLASSLHSIQIQRGAGTSSNGAGAFGATLNFSTNEVIANSYGEINNSFGLFNTRKHTLKAGTGIIKDHFTIDARLSKIYSDGYIDRANTDLHSFYVSGAYLNKRSSIRFNVFSGKEKTYQAWYGIPEADLETNRTKNYAGTEKAGSPYDNETDNYQQDHYQGFFNYKISDRMTFNTALFFTKGTGYYEQYKSAQSYSAYGLPSPVINGDTVMKTDLIRQLLLKNNFYGQLASLLYNKGKHQFTLGAGWNQYDGKHFGKLVWAANGGIPYQQRWYDLDAVKKDAYGYLKYQHTLLHNVYLFGDFQYRNVTYNIYGFRNNPSLEIKNNFHFLNPKMGITFQHKKYQYYASWSRAAKEPNRDDFEAGINQQPVPEIINDIEIGIEKKGSVYAWSITGYHMYYKNQLILTGQINDVGAYTRSNIPQSNRTGIELQAKVIFNSWLQVAGNLTLSRNRIQNFKEYLDDYDIGGQKQFSYGSTDISFSPPVIASVNTTFLPAKNVELNLFSKFVDRQFLDNTSNESRSLDGFYTQDLRINYILKRALFNEIGINILVSNLFDKKFEPNGYNYTYISGGTVNSENYYYPAAGINILIGIQVKL